MKHSTPPVMALLKRGDMVEIRSGCLRINAASNTLVRDSWMIKHSHNLSLEILKRLDIDALAYDSYKTKKCGPERYSGVCLQFFSLLSDESRFAIFNVGLDRVKKSKKGIVGSPLPKGQFRVSKRMGFYKFWKMANQQLPPRLSSFHDYMGNLKSTLFTGAVIKGEKLENRTLQLLNITYEQIMEAFYQHDLPHNKHTESIQTTYNRHTAITYNDHMESHMPWGLSSVSTTGDSSYGKRLTGSAVIRGEERREERREEAPVLGTKKSGSPIMNEWEAELETPIWMKL